jgi:hypothetical protein
MVNGLPKYVASTTHSGEPGWNGILLEGALEDSIPRLKDEVEGDLFVHGSGEFAHALAERGLVDEFEVYLNPLIWGEGNVHVLGDRGTVRLELKEVKRFDSRVVLLSYRLHLESRRSPALGPSAATLVDSRRGRCREVDGARADSNRRPPERDPGSRGAEPKLKSLRYAGRKKSSRASDSVERAWIWGDIHADMLRFGHEWPVVPNLGHVRFDTMVTTPPRHRSGYAAIYALPGTKRAVHRHCPVAVTVLPSETRACGPRW